MKGQKFAAIVVAVTLSLGFTWFQPQKKEKTPSNTTANRNEPSPASRLASTEAVAAAEEKPAVSGLPSSSSTASNAASIIRQTQGVQTQPLSTAVLPNIPAANSVPVVPSVDVSPLKDLEVVKIQKQINEIIDANEKFKSLQQSQTDQIRQITEQAQMHRRMLQELEEKNRSSRELKTSDVDEILRQEKMRIIENETEKNKNLLDQISAGKEGKKETAPGNLS